jgi:hypothetical protein
MGGMAGGGARLRLVALERLTGLSWRHQIDHVCDVLQHWNVRRVCPDRTGLGDMPVETLQAEMIARRLRCEVDDFLFTEASKRHIVDGLAIGLSKRTLRFPRYPVLLSELANFEVVSRTSTGRERMEARSGHDDTVMALGLMREAAAPFQERSVGCIGATAGQRVIGSKGRKEFSKQCELETSTWDGFLTESALQPHLWRMASFVSRCGVGRAMLARISRFSRRTMER